MTCWCVSVEMKSGATFLVQMTLTVIDEQTPLLHTGTQQDNFNIQDYPDDPPPYYEEGDHILPSYQQLVREEETWDCTTWAFNIMFCLIMLSAFVLVNLIDSRPFCPLSWPL